MLELLEPATLHDLDKVRRAQNLERANQRKAETAFATRVTGTRKPETFDARLVRRYGFQRGLLDE